MNQKNDFVISFACVEEANSIASLEKDSFSEPWSYEQICDEIKKNDVVFLTAKKDGAVLGYISGQMILDEFYISNIAVDVNFRKIGIASRLLERLIEIVKSKNAAFITLEVRESNSAARSLYEKFDFINLGVRKNFYSYPRENANIYTLYLNNEVN